MNCRPAYRLGPVSLASMVAFGLALTGCAKTEPQPAPSAPPVSAGAESTPAPAGEDQDTIKLALAKLSPEDRALAERQVTCPVSGAPLGSMDMPLKIAVKGREVFLCCKGCEKDLLSKPDEYFAKLDKPKSEAADANAKAPE